MTTTTDRPSTSRFAQQPPIVVVEHTNVTWLETQLRRRGMSFAWSRLSSRIDRVIGQRIDDPTDRTSSLFKVGHYASRYLVPALAASMNAGKTEIAIAETPLFAEFDINSEEGYEHALLLLDRNLGNDQKVAVARAFCAELGTDAIEAASNADDAIEIYNRIIDPLVQTVRVVFFETDEGTSQTATGPDGARA